jgi:hypothetical protein
MRSPSINKLPTEIHCEIFKLLTGCVDGGINNPTMGAMDPETSSSMQKLGVVAPPADAFMLPELMPDSETAVALSHVCRKWRRIMLDRPVMWSRLRITYNRLFSDLADLTREILERSRGYPLHLDVSFLVGCKRNTREDCQNIFPAAQHILANHIMRCESLRVEGRHWALYHFLKALEWYNLNSDVTAGIKWLHISEEADRRNISPNVSFPIALIAPQVLSLASQFALVSDFPTGMDRILFEDRLFSREVYWEALTMTHVKHIIVNNIDIPTARLQWQVEQDRAEYLERTASPLVSIIFNELRDSVGSICSNDRIRAAQQFFWETFLERISETLEEVWFVAISDDIWAGFISACKDIPFHFPKVRSLGLENIDMYDGGGEFKLLARLFPNLTRLMVGDVSESHGRTLIKLWSKDKSVWPQLKEIDYDDVLVDRKVGMGFKRRRPIQPTVSVEL